MYNFRVIVAVVVIGACTFRPTNQFFRKIISVDFIIFWPTRKWKIELAWHISIFLSIAKRKTELRNAHSFCFFYEGSKNQTQSDAFLFPFLEGNEKGILNHAFCFLFLSETRKGIVNHRFLFHLSEEGINGILNDWFLFSFSEGKNEGMQKNVFLLPFSEGSIK